MKIKIPNFNIPDHPVYHPEGTVANHIAIVTLRAFLLTGNFDLVFAGLFHDWFKPQGQLKSIPEGDYISNPLHAKHCMDLLENTNKGYNLHQEVMSCIQQSKSYSFVVDFDVDQKEDIDLSLLDSQIFQQQERPYNVIETRGGYHILVQPQLVDKDNKTWYNKISKLYPVDQSADQMIPIPGCIQGGFIPRIII